MKKVLTFGVFDYFHYGHLALFEQAKKYGDYLIVAVQDEKAILKYKNETSIFYTTNERCHIIESLKIVDKVLVFNDVDIDIKKIDFDVFAVGEDQDKAWILRAIDWCKNNGKEIVNLKRTKGISSSIIKEKVERR